MKTVSLATFTVCGTYIKEVDIFTRRPQIAFGVLALRDHAIVSEVDQGRAGEFSGFAVLASMKNAQSQKSVGCASTIGAAMRSVGERPSLYHATPIKGENRPLIDAPNGVHRFDDLVVLKASKVPAVLLEVGVIVNPHEEYRLADTRFVARYAAAVAQAVLTCIRPKQ